MLGDVEQDALLESEFTDEYQDWLQGNAGAKRSTWFDYPVKKLARARPVEVSKSAKVIGRRAPDGRAGGGSALIVERSLLVGISPSETCSSASCAPALTRHDPDR